jgi:hypothetical protein
MLMTAGKPYSFANKAHQQWTFLSGLTQFTELRLLKHPLFVNDTTDLKMVKSHWKTVHWEAIGFKEV